MHFVGFEQKSKIISVHRI